MLDKPRDKKPAALFSKEILGKEAMLIGIDVTEFSKYSTWTCPAMPQAGLPASLHVGDPV